MLGRRDTEQECLGDEKELAVAQERALGEQCPKG